MRLWTFVIHGETELRIRAQNQPPLEHDGEGMTIWKMVGTTEEADRMKAILEGEGLRIQRYTEYQSEEQLEERLHRLGRDR